jgi:hypothetical protein
MRFFLFFLLFPFFLSAQKSRSAYFELMGSGGFGSFNYEKVFKEKGIVDYTFRVGISYTPIDKNNGFGIIFPILVNAQIGKGRHKLELGIGQGITVTTKGSFFVLMPVVVGYRFQKEDKRIFYRVSYTPLISYLVDFQYQNSAGLSIGFTFKEKTK